MRLYIILFACNYVIICMQRGVNMGFSIFFNIEKLLFCFIKLCKCVQLYIKITLKNVVFFKKMLGWMSSPLDVQNMARAEQRISHFLLEL